MKRITSLGFLLAIVLMSACTNNRNTSADDGSGSDHTGVQNANGNIPDTSNGINLGKTLPVDSIESTDSVHQNP